MTKITLQRKQLYYLGRNMSDTNNFVYSCYQFPLQRSLATQKFYYVRPSHKWLELSGSQFKVSRGIKKFNINRIHYNDLDRFYYNGKNILFNNELSTNILLNKFVSSRSYSIINKSRHNFLALSKTSYIKFGRCQQIVEAFKDLFLSITSTTPVGMLIALQ